MKEKETLFCKECNYLTTCKKSWKRHISTRKHINNTKNTQVQYTSIPIAPHHNNSDANRNVPVRGGGHYEIYAISHNFKLNSLQSNSYGCWASGMGRQDGRARHSLQHYEFRKVCQTLSAGAMWSSLPAWT